MDRQDKDNKEQRKVHIQKTLGKCRSEESKEVEKNRTEEAKFL